MRILSSTLAVGLVLSYVVWLMPPAHGQNWQQEFLKGIKSESSDTRREAVEAIDSDSRAGVKAILAVLGNKSVARVDWYQLGPTIAKISFISEEKPKKDLEKLLKKLVKRSRDPMALSIVLEGVSEIDDDRFWQHYDTVFSPKARHPARVKRSAILAMGRTLELRFVDRILEAWTQAAEELDYRMVLACRDALREITEQDFGRELKRWQAFWDENKTGYVKPSELDEPEEESNDEDEEATEARDEREKKSRVTTVTREMPLSFTTTGREGALALLVVHDDTWSPAYFDPYLSCLDDLFKIYYVELPSISQLEEVYKDKPEKLKRNIGGYPFYPYDALCDAFDDARKEQGHQRFALFAHGFSTMVAQRYLSKYADNVSHAIMVGTFPGDDAYGNMLDRLRAKGSSTRDKELERAVDFHFITDEKTFTRFYDPKDDRELQALERKWFTIMFADRTDPEISDLWDKARLPQSSSLKLTVKEQCQSPPFDVMREKRPAIPVLVISGKKSIWFGEADGERVAKNYPINKHVVLPDAANMPWFDDPAGFQRAVRDFMRQYPEGGAQKGRKR
ncbi:alpha/beta fold hydrolase [Planctomycetota bacterium]